MSSDKKLLVIREWGEIHLGDVNKCENIDRIYLNKDAWENLEKFADSDNKEDRFLKFKNSKVLKVQNFVGVITTPDGTQIEILPKTSEDADAEKSRETLTKMLKVVHNLPFIKSTEADLQIKNQPLLEVLIGWFLDCVDEIVKQGVRQDYSRIQAQEKFLKGQLQTHKQLNEPPHKQHLFSIEYDVFSPDRAENRLIHSALMQVLKWSNDNQNQKLVKRFLTFFDEVPLSANYQDDFFKWSNSRALNYYQSILPWLKLILNQQSPFTLKDNNAGISFLLPMEVLFERYVVKILRKKYSLKVQISSKFLSEMPKAFNLKPDIAIVENGDLAYILDTKWKLIDENQVYKNGKSDKKKGISQSDVYQLFAYGKKYGVSKVFLIYPQWRKFSQPFWFNFDETLQLGVVPFPIDDDKITDFSLERVL
ncbi:McrBC 5-methylcytosine restriction system component [Bathymodiolus thermophilus thioautotrophic gill symbiont]|nr:McrBC 5-methylcytosine restriction system component [Bathymodiolus thermophilus thioautotrophic gill symbiont]